MAACALILLWVQDELSFDRFHRKAERIYRVGRSWDFREMHGQAPLATGPWGPAMQRDFPEVENFVRIEPLELAVKDHRNVFRKQRLFAADNSLFEIFDFHLEKGDPAQALPHPYTVVMTAEMAQTYFGNEEAVGQLLTVDWEGEPTAFKVTGILETAPANSHIHFDILLSLSSYPEDALNRWFGPQHYTYILLAEDASLSSLKRKFPAFLEKYVADEFMAYFGPDIAVTDVFQVTLKPLLDIHLNPSREMEIEPPGSAGTVYLFSVIAVLVLLIACINFINLSTARANKRAREVGMRKAVGAQKRQLVAQFLGESLVLVLLALILAIGILSVSLPTFNSISGKHISTGLIFQYSNFIALLAMAIVAGVLAGLYPAFYLSAFNPVKVLKGQLQSGSRKPAFRRIMTIFQFAISISIIIGSFIVYQQLAFMQNKSLGFDKENVVIIPAESNGIRSNIETFRDKLQADQRIKSVSASSMIPGTKILHDTNFRRRDNGEVYNLMYIRTDYEFIDTYHFDLIRGRQFSREHGTDRDEAFILNERAVRSLGYTLDEVVGKKLDMTAGPSETHSGTVIGIVKDFHLQSMHLKIQPTVFLMGSNEAFNKITIRLAGEGISRTLPYIKQTWRSVYPGEQFKYTFLDNRLDQLYTAEKRVRKIFLLFAGLSIFIACLGLMGLATFTSEARKKEIGIRKTLGASVAGMILLLSIEFTKWILLANLVAWPIAWFTMNHWLQSFAYRINMDIGTFLFSGVLALLIALLTVGFQAIKAAIANPVDALRYE